MVERQPSKLNVAGSNPVSRSKMNNKAGLPGEKFIPSVVEGNPVSRSKVPAKAGISSLEMKRC